MLGCFSKRQIRASRSNFWWSANTHKHTDQWSVTFPCQDEGSDCLLSTNQNPDSCELSSWNAANVILLVPWVLPAPPHLTLVKVAGAVFTPAGNTLGWRRDWQPTDSNNTGKEELHHCLCGCLVNVDGICSQLSNKFLSLCYTDRESWVFWVCPACSCSAYMDQDALCASQTQLSVQRGTNTSNSGTANITFHTL